MSYSGELRLSIVQGDLRGISAVRRLVDGGWMIGVSPEHAGAITWYGSNAPNRERDGRFTIESGSCDAVWELLGDLSRSGTTFFVPLYWPRDGAGAVNYFFDPEESRLMFSLSETRRRIAGTELADYNWYIVRLLRPLMAAGCVVDVVELVETPSLMFHPVQ